MKKKKCCHYFSRENERLRIPIEKGSFDDVDDGLGSIGSGTRECCLRSQKDTANKKLLFDRRSAGRIKSYIVRELCKLLVMQDIGSHRFPERNRCVY